MVTHYPLGTNDLELERLRFQHEVWGGVTRAFLDRIGVGRGAHVLDLGCGPGFVSYELSERVGASGSVIALDESPRWLEFIHSELARRKTTNVRAVESRIENLDVAPGSLDVVFARWVFSFLRDPDDVARRIARLLKPGGVLAIEDYNHEGVSLFPESDGFRAIVRGTRALYSGMGGDAFVSGRAARIFRAAGLETIELKPNVMCGGPDTPVFRWADLFFPHFSAVMEEKGLVTPAERALFLAEWSARKSDPTTLFFSPIVVDAAARKPR
jgi:SAM-dependent methyltransferase